MRPYLITAKLMRPSNMKRFPTPGLNYTQTDPPDELTLRKKIDVRVNRVIAGHYCTCSAMWISLHATIQFYVLIMLK
jgi:hypothetical protein